MRTMTMRHSALLAWRSPPLWWRRCPELRPESAGTGDTPHMWAQAASEWSRSGLSPAATRSVAAVSGPTPNRASRSGAVAMSSDSIFSSNSATSASRDWTRWASEESDALVAAVNGSADRVGRSFAASPTSAVTDRPFRREWSWSGAVNPRWRIWTMAFTLAWRAERLATIRTRIDSTGPSLVLPTPDARPLMAARAASTASRGSDLPWLLLEPDEQRFVAGGIGIE